jgi:hypothetical protein
MKIKLLEYDRTTSFFQIKTELEKCLRVTEVRVSEDLWSMLISSVDQDFYDNIDTNKTANQLKEGYVADAYGVPLTSEIVIKNLTQAQPLYGMYYMVFYGEDAPHAAPTQGTSAAPDLLALAIQLTQP